MDLVSSPVEDAISAEGRDALTALGAAMFAWLAVAGLLSVTHSAPVSGAVANPRLVAPWLAHLLIPLLAGFICTVAGASLSRRSRVHRATLLWVGWSLAASAMAILPDQWERHRPWSDLDLIAQQLGLGAGIAMGAFTAVPWARRLAKVVERGNGPTRGLIVAASVAVILLPISPDSELLESAGGFHLDSAMGYAKALPGQIYLALKSVILWVPLGMLYALAHRRQQLEAWAIAGVMALVLVGLPLLGAALEVRDVVEILSAYWGVALGLVLGEAVSHTLPDSADAAVPGVAPEIRSQLAGSVPSTHPASPADAGAAVPNWKDRGDNTASNSAAATWARRTLGVLLLFSAVTYAGFFPRWGGLLATGLALYALLLWRHRHAWLLLVPAALPLLNLAPGTGRYFFDEFDLLMTTTVAMALWHGACPEPRHRLARTLAVTLALFGMSVAISILIGLLPLSPLDANALANYWSHYNSLRVAKGYLWMLPVLVLMLWTVPVDAGMAMRLFVPGMWLGLAGVVAVGLWERWLFAGLFDLSSRYRITATFASMHTGGSEIETYLVTAIPFVWLAFGHERPAPVRLAGICLLVAGAYLMTLTIARAGVLGLGFAACVMLLGVWRTLPHLAMSKGVTAAFALALVGGVTAFAFGLSGGYLQSRLTQSEGDLRVRFNHWQKALAMRDDDVLTSMFGMGLGRFPETYLYRSGDSLPPGTYRFAADDDGRYLSLGGGETLYMAQRVPVRDRRRYTLSLRVRSSDPGAKVGVPVCEKHLLDSRHCQWQVISVPADGQWHTQSIAIDSGPVGEGNWFTRRPVELSLYNESERTRIDVDDVQLRDDSGVPLVRNGDFSAGADYWYFKTHSHLPWHIKNLWVEILFEQGWFGLGSFMFLLVALVSRLARAVWRGNPQASVLLASTSGFLVVGLFGSLFDAPRIATLFFLIVVLAGTVVPTEGGSTHKAGTRVT